ncbi:aspartate carbamoyltransferase [Nanoarchaeota archaeon]
MADMCFQGRDIISMRDFSREEIEFILREGEKLRGDYREDPRKFKSRRHSHPELAFGILFFENSTRTRLSTEAAISEMGAFFDGFTSSEGTSVGKGEPLRDTVRMFTDCFHYDGIFMRHPLEGAARFASEFMGEGSIVSCGDGPLEHPTQTLLDLLTIQEAHGNINGLTIALGGDLKYGRTVHSLLLALANFNVDLHLTAPAGLEMPEFLINDYERKSGRKVTLHQSIEEVIGFTDVYYATRVQRERFPDTAEGQMEYEIAKAKFVIDTVLLERCKPKKDMIILHPLPRNKYALEITFGVDDTPYAWYIPQAANGPFTREAVTRIISGIVPTGKHTRATIGEEEPRFEEMELCERRGYKKDLYKIDNGTLIDHIANGLGHQALRLLKLDQYRDSPVIPGYNIPSSRAGKKDIIGISQRELQPKDLTRLAILCPDATINIVRDGKIHRKFRMQLPEYLKDLIECPNTKCITHPETYEGVPTIFHNESSERQFRCHYCTRPISTDEVKIKS